VTDERARPAWRKQPRRSSSALFIMRKARSASLLVKGKSNSQKESQNAIVVAFRARSNKFWLWTVSGAGERFVRAWRGWLRRARFEEAARYCCCQAR